MISIGIAVRRRIGPAPYAVAAASPAIERPTVAAGADDAIPMTVSCATPIALGSSLATGRGTHPATDDAVCSAMRFLSRTCPNPEPAPARRAGIRPEVLMNAVDATWDFSKISTLNARVMRYVNIPG